MHIAYKKNNRQCIYEPIDRSVLADGPPNLYWQYKRSVFQHMIQWLPDV